MNILLKIYKKIPIQLLCIMLLFLGCNNVVNELSNDNNSAECNSTDCPPVDAVNTLLLLQTLSVNTGILSPVFSRDITEYTLLVPLLTEKIMISPTAENSLALVSIRHEGRGDEYATGEEIYIQPGQNNISITVTGEDGISEKVYTILAERKIQSQKVFIKASNAEAGDQFGNHMASSGNTLVVGSPYEDGDNSGDQFVNVSPDYSSGAAYVYVKNGDTWTQQAYLKASNAEGVTGNHEQGDRFGLSVAIYDDIIAVGAPGESSNSTTINSGENDNSASASGAVYIFVRTGSTWTQEAYIKPDNTAANAIFGWSVALYGNTLVVGSPYESSVSLCSGAVYVFERNNGIWSQKQHITSSNAGWGDWFGWDVDINGDIIIASAPLEDSNSTTINSGKDINVKLDYDSGALYVITKSSGTWSETAYLKPSSNSEKDWFGYFAKVMGNTIVAASKNGSGGAVFVFARDPGSQLWTQSGHLKSTYYVSSEFYVSPAISADENVIAFGAPGDCSDTSGINLVAISNNNKNASGAVFTYILNKTTNQWQQTGTYLKIAEPTMDDAFGWRVLFMGNSLLAAAALEDSDTKGINSGVNDNASNSGAVYVFE